MSLLDSDIIQNAILLLLLLLLLLVVVVVTMPSPWTCNNRLIMTKRLTGRWALWLVGAFVWVDIHIDLCRLVVGYLLVAVHVHSVNENGVVTVHIDTPILNAFK